MLSPPSGLQLSFHADHEDQRRRVIGALWESFDPVNKAAAAGLNDCCRWAKIFIDPDPGRVRRWIMRCKHRLCPFCGRKRTADLVEWTTDLIRQMHFPKHFTLTYRSNDLPLDRQIDQLRAAWKMLRNSPVWKAHVSGGVYTLESTRNADTGRWHPHVHIIADSVFFLHRKLKAAWRHCMTGGLNVWITPVRNPRKGAAELCSYVGKAPSFRDYTPEAIQDYAAADKGRRRVSTFGSFYGSKPPKPDNMITDGPRVYHVELSRVVYLANRGHDVAVDLTSLIARRWPEFRRYLDFALADVPALASFERRPLWAELADGDSSPRSPPAAAGRDPVVQWTRGRPSPATRQTSPAWPRR